MRHTSIRTRFPPKGQPPLQFEVIFCVRGVISPLLANIYLHYVLDQWVMNWRKESAKGEVIIVRYADDFVLGFQHRQEADRFLKQLRERMAAYGLEVHPEKTRLIRFGRFAAEDRKRDGAGKPETFNFLGFTHICGTIWKSGKFTVVRKTVGKRMTAKVQSIAANLSKRRNDPIEQTGDWLKQVVRGYYNYYAVPGNQPRLQMFQRATAQSWLNTLRRRSQSSRWTWERFGCSLTDFCLSQEFYILTRWSDFAPHIQDKSRVR